MLKTGDVVVRMDHVAQAKKMQQVRRANPFLKLSLTSNATNPASYTRSQVNDRVALQMAAERYEQGRTGAAMAHGAEKSSQFTFNPPTTGANSHSIYTKNSRQ